MAGSRRSRFLRTLVLHQSEVARRARRRGTEGRSRPASRTWTCQARLPPPGPGRSGGLQSPRSCWPRTPGLPGARLRPGAPGAPPGRRRPGELAAPPWRLLDSVQVSARGGARLDPAGRTGPDAVMVTVGRAAPAFPRRLADARGGGRLGPSIPRDSCGLSSTTRVGQRRGGAPRWVDGSRHPAKGPDEEEAARWPLNVCP